MPKAPDFKVFLKLMNLTTSSFDHEALSAIRMANAVLARTNQTWDDLLHGKVVMIAAQDQDLPSAEAKWHSPYECSGDRQLSSNSSILVTWEHSKNG